MKCRATELSSSWLRPALVVTTFFLAALVLCGCRTLAPIQSFDVDEAGWTLKRGQGIWRSEGNGDELVIDFTFATHIDGRIHFQVFKEVLPLVTVQIVESHWLVDEPLRKRRTGGEVVGGEALKSPARAGWLQLALGLGNRRTVSQWQLTRTGSQKAVFENTKTGERMELFFDS
jgi:hypothetical protein